MEMILYHFTSKPLPNQQDRVQYGRYLHLLHPCLNLFWIVLGISFQGECFLLELDLETFFGSFMPIFFELGFLAIWGFDLGFAFAFAFFFFVCTLQFISNIDFVLHMFCDHHQRRHISLRFVILNLQRLLLQSRCLK